MELALGASTTYRGAQGATGRRPQVTGPQVFANHQDAQGGSEGEMESPVVGRVVSSCDHHRNGFRPTHEEIQGEEKYENGVGRGRRGRRGVQQRQELGK